MKIQFSILSTLLCMFALSSWANTTTDNITFSETELSRGGDYKTISVNFVAGEDGNTLSNYSAFQMDIYLPAGYEFVQVENEDEELEWACNGAACKSTHSTSPAIREDGALRVSVMSTKSATFRTTSDEIFKFYVKASSYVSPGYAKIGVKTCALIDASAVKYNIEDESINDKVSASESTTVAVAVNVKNQWSTFVSPCAAAIPEGVVAYRYKELNKDENKVYVTQQSAFEAFVPYVLYAENGYSGTITGNASATDYENKVANGVATDGKLVGAIEAQSVNEGYVLQNLDEGVKFYSMGGDTFTIPVGKCYLLPADAGSKLSIAFEDETDGINTINADEENTIYDLAGRKLQNPQQRGIYIVNGKKVVKK